jgi:uncharacterized glyoxalase superfamily protein PhnB
MTNPAPGAKRAQPESFRARTVSFSLTVKDFPKSLAWYTNVIGFIVDRNYEREGKIVGARLKAGDVEFSLNQDDGKKGADRVVGQGFSLMFMTAQNVDEIAARIKRLGGTLDSEPADMPWGARIFRITDPDGYKLVFSSERAA